MTILYTIRGRLGGLARAEKLSPERRHEIAKKAANKRWHKKKRKEAQKKC